MAGLHFEQLGPHSCVVLLHEGLACASWFTIRPGEICRCPLGPLDATDMGIILCSALFPVADHLVLLIAHHRHIREYRLKPNQAAARSEFATTPHTVTAIGAIGDVALFGCASGALFKATLGSAAVPGVPGWRPVLVQLAEPAGPVEQIHTIVVRGHPAAVVATAAELLLLRGPDLEPVGRWALAGPARVELWRFGGETRAVLAEAGGPGLLCLPLDAPESSQGIPERTPVPVEKMASARRTGVLLFSHEKTVWEPTHTGQWRNFWRVAHQICGLAAVNHYAALLLSTQEVLVVDRSASKCAAFLGKPVAVHPSLLRVQPGSPPPPDSPEDCEWDSEDLEPPEDPPEDAHEDSMAGAAAAPIAPAKAPPPYDASRRALYVSSLPVHVQPFQDRTSSWTEQNASLPHTNGLLEPLPEIGVGDAAGTVPPSTGGIPEWADLLKAKYTSDQPVRVGEKRKFIVMDDTVDNRPFVLAAQNSCSSASCCPVQSPPPPLFHAVPATAGELSRAVEAPPPVPPPYAPPRLPPPVPSPSDDADRVAALRQRYGGRRSPTAPALAPAPTPTPALAPTPTPASPAPASAPAPTLNPTPAPTPTPTFAPPVPVRTARAEPTSRGPPSPAPPAPRPPPATAAPPRPASPDVRPPSLSSGSTPSQSEPDPPLPQQSEWPKPATLAVPLWQRCQRVVADASAATPRQLRCKERCMALSRYCGSHSCPRCRAEKSSGSALCRACRHCQRWLPGAAAAALLGAVCAAAAAWRAGQCRAMADNDGDQVCSARAVVGSKFCESHRCPFCPGEKGDLMARCRACTQAVQRQVRERYQVRMAHLMPSSFLTPVDEQDVDEGPQRGPEADGDSSGAAPASPRGGAGAGPGRPSAAPAVPEARPVKAESSAPANPRSRVPMVITLEEDDDAPTEDEDLDVVCIMTLTVKELLPTAPQVDPPPRRWHTFLYPTARLHLYNKVVRNPAVSIQLIRSPKDHPCRGQYGLFAGAAGFPANTEIGIYTGVVHTTESANENSRYLAQIPVGRRRGQFHVDGERMGNEMKFINDPKGTAASPNVRLPERTSFDALGLPVIPITTTCCIAPNVELLLDYGDETYWSNRRTSGVVPGKGGDEELPNVSVEGFPAGHEFTSVPVWDWLDDKLLHSIARPKPMEAVTVTAVKEESTGVVSFVALAKRLIPKGEVIGILGGRIVDTVEPGAVVYVPRGTKIHGIQAENEARYFLDEVHPNCGFQMRWTEHGAMFFEIQALRDIPRKAELTMNRFG